MKHASTLALALLLAATTGCGSEDTISAVTEAVSDGDSYWVTYTTNPSTIPLNESFSVTAMVHDNADTSLMITGATVDLDATMPEHGHGMNTDPVVTSGEDGIYTGEGFLFHMEGAWELNVDITVDGVGYDATRATASAATRPGGVILHVGLGGGSAGLDIRRITLQEISFIGTYTYTAQDFRDTSAAMFDGRLGPLDWMEIRPLHDGARAFSEIRAGAIAAPKIILKP